MTRIAGRGAAVAVLGCMRPVATNSRVVGGFSLVNGASMPRRDVVDGDAGVDAAAPGAIARRYRVEPHPTSHRDHVAFSATRRGDEFPAWILVPQWPRAERFANAVGFIRTAKRSLRLRHPQVVRTLDVGLLADGRPYAVIARLPAQPLGAALAQRGSLPWAAARGVALRLCSAVEAVRRAGLAPRSLDVEGCILVDGTADDVRLEGLFVPSEARLPETDAPAIAMIVHALLGVEPRGPAASVTEARGLDNVLLRALGSMGYGSVRELQVALAAIDDAGRRESHGANHAETFGEFVFDTGAEDARARPPERAPTSRRGPATAGEPVDSGWHGS